jgi:uncharacterized protein
VRLKQQYDKGFRKRQSNIQKHRGISFERAMTIFRDPNLLSIFDDEHSDDEDRWITLGLDSTGNLLVVIHTFNATTSQSVTIRIISARRADPQETRQYQEGLS